MGNLIMTLTFVICLYTITSSKETCVDKDCVCKHQTQLDFNGMKPQLTCQRKNLSSISKTLRSSSKNISGIFGTIIIRDEFSEIVNPNLLGTINVPIIILSLPKVQKLGTSTFSGQESNIKALIISDTILSKIPIAAIENLEKLSDFQINDAVNIEEIEERCFDRLSPATIDSLRNFGLHNSSLRSIGSNAFSALTNLDFLMLTESRLETFPSGVLPVQQLSLYIHSNNFTDMQQNALDDLSPESEISFIGNMISSTSLDAWNTIIQKKFTILLQDNPIKCDCNLMPLLKLNETEKKVILLTFTYKGKVYESLCATPKDLENRTISSLTQEDMKSQDCKN